MTRIHFRLVNVILILITAFICLTCSGDNSGRNRGADSSIKADTTGYYETIAEYLSEINMLLLPENPVQGEPIRILSTGGKNLLKARLNLMGPSGSLKLIKSMTGEDYPYWRIDDFIPDSNGKYKAELISGSNVLHTLEFDISPRTKARSGGVIWKARRGWDSGMEVIYSVWVNALFHGCDERSSWAALHEVTQNQNNNFLFNYLSLGEDDPQGKNRLIMQPDCADNPFFLRAYFAWKLGLPFGFHVCDRGYLGHNPRTGTWITNETSTSNTDPVLAFNSFLRRVKDVIHSGTARTSLDDETSDYYPVPLEYSSLRPGIVYADPYGHTLIIIGWVLQTLEHPGLLLAVDAQPDGTIAIKRFWKGNFLFNTSGVVGEPGFKAFRPISKKNDLPYLMHNEELTSAAGFVPFSLQQRNMESDVFYHTMERLINPKPLDPEAALQDLIQALHEQLMVRVNSVANGEAYFKLHPGAVIPMPSSAAGIFQAGGQWEDYSTPNRDLRLLIAMDAILDFPDLVARSPADFNIRGSASSDQVKRKLQSILDQKVTELSITYTRSDGSIQLLTVGEILKRRDAFEMAYNPNDGIEIRWGAPENSDERSTCRRRAPSNQLEKMRSVRTWFSKRLHPPT